MVVRMRIPGAGAIHAEGLCRHYGGGSYAKGDHGGQSARDQLLHDDSPVVRTLRCSEVAQNRCPYFNQAPSERHMNAGITSKTLLRSPH
jgi:hypothetical protein